MQRAVVEAGPRRPPGGASVLSRYITRVRNSFQNLGPPIPETPELTVPATVGTRSHQKQGFRMLEGLRLQPLGNLAPPPQLTC